MRQQYRDDMWTHWEASGKLAPRPNRITGSVDPKYCEWLIRDEEFDHIKGYQQGSKVQSSGEARPEDLENIRGLRLSLENVFENGAAQKEPPAEESGAAQKEPVASVAVKKEKP